MKHRQASQGQNKGAIGWKRVNTWPIKGPFLVAAGLLGFFDHDLGWGRTALVCGIAIVLPVIGFRDFWNEARFWITGILLAILQVPLAIALRPTMERLRFPFMLLFGILDCALVVTALSWVCTNREGNDGSG